MRNVFAEYFKYGNDVSFFKALLNDHDRRMLIIPDQDIFEKDDFDFRDVHKNGPSLAMVDKCVDGTVKQEYQRHLTLQCYLKKVTTEKSFQFDLCFYLKAFAA